MAVDPPTSGVTEGSARVPRQTTLARLLQDRREAAGISRARLGATIGISPGTIEGWEMGRVAKPPIHDVLRLAHYLRITPDEVARATFEDAEPVPPPDEFPGEKERKQARRRRRDGAVPLLEAAFQLFGWKDDDEAAEALDSTPERVRAWRRGQARMELAEYMTLTSMIGMAAAQAMSGNHARIADLAAAVDALGLEPPSAGD